MDNIKNTSRLRALDDDRGNNARSGAFERNYTAVVKKLRWALPIAALCVIAILMIWPKIEIEISERRFTAPPVDRAALEKAATENKLISANFSSVDSKGRPFTITSTQAVQANNDPDTILLENPHGTLKISDDVTMTAQSKNGIFAQEAQHLNLTQDVVLTRSDGTVMNTQTLFVNLATNDAKTDDDVTIDGPQGHLIAKGMTMKNGGTVTIFNGPAKLILNSKTSINPKGDS